MPENVGGGTLRAIVAGGVRDGLSWNEIRTALREGGVSATSTDVSTEYRYAIGLNQGFVDFTGGGLGRVRDNVPTADSFTQSPVAWSDRFNARVAIYGKDTESGQFSRKWINVGYDRLPTYGTIADTALVLANFGDSDPTFQAISVSGVTVEENSQWQVA